MQENKINATIAIISLIAAVLMAAALSFAIGKWSWGKHGYELTIKFPNSSGITANSEVKYAGVHAGRVREIRPIARQDQTEDPGTKLFNCVEVVVEVDNKIEIGDDVAATIKQDGFGISAKYVLLTPGPDHASKALVDGDHVQGEMPFDLADLIQPAGDALEQAKSLVAQMQPVMVRLDALSQKNVDRSAAVDGSRRQVPAGRRRHVGKFQHARRSANGSTTCLTAFASPRKT